MPALFEPDASNNRFHRNRPRSGPFHCAEPSVGIPFDRAESPPGGRRTPSARSCPRKAARRRRRRRRPSVRGASDRRRAPLPRRFRAAPAAARPPGRSPRLSPIRKHMQDAPKPFREQYGRASRNQILPSITSAGACPISMFAPRDVSEKIDPRHHEHVPVGTQRLIGRRKRTARDARFDDERR